VFTKEHDLHQVYATLRRFRDSNGHNLRKLVKEICMDDMDDSMISPLVMLIKFPHLQHLSARQRRLNTNLEADSKILQEWIKGGLLVPGSLSLERLDLFHYNMASDEPFLELFEKTVNRISKNSVTLDIKRCGYPKQHTSLPSETEDGLSQDDRLCKQIIDRFARCWACDAPQQYCWQCTIKCAGCGTNRLPPVANDNQRRTRTAKSAKVDEFGLFD
ncbi:hypothetical protein BC940DRAFT_353130, partial [Gongronella butleri]